MGISKMIAQDEDETEEAWYEHRSFSVDKGQGLLRIDKFLFMKMEHVSRNRIQKAADAGCIRVNGAPVKSNYKVKPLDTISLVFPNPPRATGLLPEDIPLDILFEDEHLIIVNKPAGMVVHPGVGNHSGTLVNGLFYHFNKLPILANGFGEHGQDIRPGLVHRIDKDTSGLLVAAKTEEAMTFLAAQFFERTIDRHYVALVWGNVKEEQGTIIGFIGRDPNERKRFKVFTDESEGKHAVTHFKVLQRFDYVTLVQCKLETGRTHQIRVHMKHIGHPLFNDPKYGGDRIAKGPDTQKYKRFIENGFMLLPGQALFAQSLGFIHPHNKQKMYFEAPLPEAFETLLNKWRKANLKKELEDLD
jgi:23S rRNA pseudouridine1911/1915/1917 synthase